MVAALEKVARDYVDSWIERGMLTGEMQSQANELCQHFEAFLERDIRKFAETGKYPQYVED
jgi:hypothetical protein